MTPRSLTLPLIEQQLAGFSPQRLQVGGNRHAAVAMILRQMAARVEVLLIERTRRSGDPWSGQMAFPGGMVNRSDRSSRAAAERETEEETGISLAGSAYVGRIDDMQGRHHAHPSGIVVSAFVYAIGDPEFSPRTNDEVNDVLWVPLTVFAETSRMVTLRYPSSSGCKFSGIQISKDPERIVWGLTHRFLSSFFKAMELNVISSGD